MKVTIEIPDSARVMTYQVVYIEGCAMTVKSEVIDSYDLAMAKEDAEVQDEQSDA